MTSVFVSDSKVFMSKKLANSYTSSNASSSVEELPIISCIDDLITDQEFLKALKDLTMDQKRLYHKHYDLLYNHYEFVETVLNSVTESEAEVLYKSIVSGNPIPKKFTSLVSDKTKKYLVEIFECSFRDLANFKVLIHTLKLLNSIHTREAEFVFEEYINH